jgi:hypothetical protein
MSTPEDSVCAVFSSNRGRLARKAGGVKRMELGKGQGKRRKNGTSGGMKCVKNMFRKLF